MGKPLIFTDLDGTFLNETYSFDDTLPALTFINQHGVPLVICSSKTRQEIEFYRAKLNNNHPFISENGGGIFIPRGYFGPNATIPGGHQTTETKYDVIRLGAQYADLRKTLKVIQKEGFSIKGFGDMTAEEVALAMGFALEEAKMAKERDFDEPFFFNGQEEEIENLIHSIQIKGFNVTKGRIYHLLGQSDKGKAVSIVIDLYKRQYGSVTTIALGDNPNDLPMLRVVDIPVVVQKPDETYDASITAPGLIKAQGIGPVGWNNAMMSIIPKLLDPSPVNSISQ